MSRSDEARERERERAQAKRDAFRAQGLTARGKPRKGYYKPKPHQAMKIVQGPPKPKEPSIPKKGETPEQRRARGFSIRGTPLATDIERRVRRLVEGMSDD